MKTRHALSAVALVAGCASGPLQPDLAATAPRLDGFGSTSFAPTTTSAKAREHFQSGALQAWAFNEREAVRQFKAALAADPACALCAWGVAWQLGPHINAPQRDRQIGEAQRYIDLAVRLAPAATPRERGFIEAMALRYGHASTARETAPLQAARCGPGRDEQRDPLDRAYADHLHQKLQHSPGDAELLTLWTEAEMIATPGPWYSPAGAPRGRLREIVERLEQALDREPNHTGLNHYLIHAADAPAVAQRAVAAADRLAALAPKSPHLVHMPAHTYAHVGRYADATKVSQQAVQADSELAAAQRAQGFEPSKDWTYHNLHFQWFGALMEGRGDLALANARQLATMAAAWTGPYGEYVRSLPALTLLRLERWAALAAEAAPSHPATADAGGVGLAAALHGHAVAVARLHLGTAGDSKTALAESRSALAKVVEANARLARAHAKPRGFDATLRGIGEAAQSRLMAEIALAEQQPQAAFAQQLKAVTASAEADRAEPPMLAGGALHALAQMQLRAGRAQLAEATFRRDLERWPDSGWSLTGLARSLDAQQRSADAQAVRSLVARAWPIADAALR